MFCAAFVAVNVTAGLVWQAASTNDIGAVWQRAILALLFLLLMGRLLERRIHERAARRGGDDVS